MSLLTSLLINVTMIATTLLADRGVRAVGWARLLRPLLVGAPIALYFSIHDGHLVTHGLGLVLEIGGALLGLALGAGAVTLARVGRDEVSDRIVTRTGTGYFAFWIGACVLRFAFSYGAQHWFGRQMSTWMYVHGIALTDIAAVITNAIVFSVLGMLLARSAGLALRARAAASTDFALAR